MRHPIARALFALVALALVAPAARAEDLVFVVSADNAAEVSWDLVRDLYWGRRPTWPTNGRPVKLCFRSEGDPLNDVLFRDYLKTTPERFQKYWKSQVLAGRGGETGRLKDVKAVVSHAVKNTGAIAFVSLSEAEKLTSRRVRKIRIAPPPRPIKPKPRSTTDLFD